MYVTRVAWVGAVVVALAGQIAEPRLVRSGSISGHAGVISGRVTTSRGDPVVAINIEVFRRVIKDRRVQGSVAGRAVTDDRGMYRVWNLEPGAYVAVIPPGQGSMLAPGPPTDAPRAKTAFPLMFYPGTTTSPAAQMIQVSSGEERADVDFRVDAVPAVSIVGAISSGAGPLTNIVPQLWVADELIAGTFSQGAPSLLSDGSFKFFGLTRGRYEIRASGSAGRQVTLQSLPPSLERLPAALLGGVALAGSLTVDVGTADVSGVQLVLRPAVLITGRLAFEDGEPLVGSTPTLRTLAVAARAVSDPPEFSSGQVQPDGTFSVRRNFPGRHLIEVNWLPAGWKVHSAVVGSVDAADVPVDFDAVAGKSVVVTVTDRLAEIDGVVTGAAGPDAAAVILFSTDPAAWNPAAIGRRLTMVRADRDGRYQFRELLPGNYFIAAVPDEAAADWYDPRFLSALARQATRVDLSGRDHTTIGLRTMTVPR